MTYNTDVITVVEPTPYFNTTASRKQQVVRREHPRDHNKVFFQL